MATRMFARRSRTYAAAAPLDVAITETIDAPIGSDRRLTRAATREIRRGEKWPRP
jgi:hypothetical protein